MPLREAEASFFLKGGPSVFLGFTQRKRRKKRFVFSKLDFFFRENEEVISSVHLPNLSSEIW
jgi:hypothetical protein